MTGRAAVLVTAWLLAPALGLAQDVATTHPVEPPASDPVRQQWARQSGTRPPWLPAEGPADLAMRLVRVVPLAHQATALIALDWSLPLGLGVAGALLGAGAGALVASLPARSGGAPQWVRPGSPRLQAATAVGALLGAGAVMLPADLLLSSFHLRRVAPARLVGLAVLLPAVLLVAAAAAWVAQPLFAVPRPVAAGGMLLTGFVWALSWLLLPLTAASLSLLVRGWADYQEGSVLWTQAPS